MPQTAEDVAFQELIARRYGEDAPKYLQHFESSNPTLDLLLSHKSTRHYKDEALPPGTVEALAAAAQSASTSSNLQAWSMIALQDPARKSEAATLCANQDFIRHAPLFLIFCADLARLTWVSEQEDSAGEGLKYLEMFLLASLDAALAAQNASVAAESLGLGICCVGGARNKPRELAQLLNLPQRVIALFGLAVGYPQDDLATTAKPRLPQPGLLHYETYRAEDWEPEVESYNATMSRFYEEQKLENHASWSASTAKRVGSKRSLAGRDELRAILHERGFELR